MRRRRWSINAPISTAAIAILTSIRMAMTNLKEAAVRREPSPTTSS